MAKQTVKIGWREVTLDLITKDEIAQVTREILSGYLRPPEDVFFPGGGITDGSGNLTLDVYQPQAGMELVLTRLLVATDQGNGSTPATVYTNASGYVLIQAQKRTVDFVSLVANTGSLPKLWTWGDSFGPRFTDLDVLRIVVNAGPASTGITVTGQGFLAPMTATLT